MPKVIIWRDDAVETEFDPAHRDWRIGRSETNDIALLDPRKSVSRFHAELREENGQWYFIDLNSQNGSWQRGERVTRLLLEHDVEVTFGDYRLVFVNPQRTAAPIVAAPVVDPNLDTAAAGAPNEPPPPPPPTNPDETLIMPSARKDDTPTPPAGTPVVRPKAPPAKVKKGVNPAILVVFLLAMFGAVAAVAWRVYDSLGGPAPTSTVTTPPVTPAPPPTPAPQPAPVADAIVPAAEPDPVPTPVVEPTPAAPTKGRVARKQVTPPAPKVPPEVEAQYTAGRRALTAQRYGEAARAFEAVLAALPGFRDTEALLAESRTREREVRTQALADGQRLEGAGEWAAAVSAYERAGASSEASAARTRMHAAGDDAYRKARQFDARGRAVDAIGWYERAAEWLASTDPRRQTARDRLAELKGGNE